MSNLFENEELSFKYSNNWKKMDVDDDLENCLAIFDHKSGYSRVMIVKYLEEGLSLEYLKSAIEDIPRVETLKCVKSDFIIIGNKESYELIAIDESHEPPLKTRSIACIGGRDAYVFNFMSFGLENPDEEAFLNIYRTLEFK